MSYLHELQRQVNELKDIVDGKDLQARLIESDMVEIFSASDSASEITQITLQIMMELNQFVQKKGWTDATKASQVRLTRLLELSSHVGTATDANYKLKLVNRELHTNYQILRVENKELKSKLQAIINAENF